MKMKESIRLFLEQNLSFLPDEMIVIIVSAMPVLELRGGMPLAFAYGFTFWEALFYSVLGNLLPILPMILLFQPISKWMMKFNWYARFYQWLYERTLNKGKNVEKFGAIGLILFTAIPLPTTGAYSASIAASLFGIRVMYAFWAIATGVLIAGLGVGLVLYSIF
jgi:uncharacterized membrane protein